MALYYQWSGVGGRQMDMVRAGWEHLDALIPLFDQYRVFYHAPSDPEAAKRFLQDRFRHGDSAIFVARHHGSMVGFTQLYPSLSSVSMQRVWILNDLFVAPAYRQQGVATRLLHSAKDFAQATGAVRITLATQIDNAAAQSLYEAFGYSKEAEFYHYVLKLPESGFSAH